MQPGSIPNTASTLGIYAIQPPRPGSPPVHDPKDGNRDGLVSFGEAWSYSLNHPEQTILKELRMVKETGFPHIQDAPVPATPKAHGQTGSKNSAWGTAKGNLDLLA